MASSIELAGRLSAVVATQQEVLAAISDLDKVMSLVVERTPEATNSDGAVIEVVDGDDLVYRAASGAAKDQAGLRLTLSKSLSGLAVREKTLMRCDNTETDPRVDGAACRAMGIRSMMIAPLLEGTIAVGALKTFSQVAQAFCDLDAYVLQLLAGMTSAAMLQARTFRELEASEARYRMLFDRNIAGVFRSTFDGRILDCNESLAQYLGYDSREELLLQPAWNLYHQRADREELIRLVQQNQTMLNIRMPFRRKDGTSLLGMISASIVRSSSGEQQLLGTMVEA
jgi:PAS domain S-box-containing protein